jgi:lipoprotein-anchoring transpeptidase ErfK/SrfK
MRVAIVLVGALAGALLLAAPGLAAAAGVQRVATLERSMLVYARPGVPTSETVAAQRPLTRQRTILPVTGAARGPQGTRWVRVLLPGRPNGHQGWIRQAAVRLGRTPWRVVVDTARRRLTVFHGGRAMRSFPAVVGKPSTPTPRGAFFVEEAISLPSYAPGAPYAFALSARSNVFQEFDGGPGQIAMHGTYGIGGIPGTAVSHGCIRLDSSTLRWMIARFGRGTPVTIR